jgi:hypothetical protein
MLLSSLVLMLSSCSTYNENPVAEPNLIEILLPDARISLSEEPGKIKAALGLINTTNQSIPMIENFEGNWVLLNSAGDNRASGAMLTAGPIEPNQSRYPLVWSAKLEPGTYTLKWAAPSLGTVIVNFEVFGDGDSLGVGIIGKEISDDVLIKTENFTTQ